MGPYNYRLGAIVCAWSGLYCWRHAFINGLRNVRAQTASMLIAGLEPVCAIVFAFLLGEVLHFKHFLEGH